MTGGTQRHATAGSRKPNVPSLPAPHHRGLRPATREGELTPCKLANARNQGSRPPPRAVAQPSPRRCPTRCRGKAPGRSRGQRGEVTCPRKHRPGVADRSPPRWALRQPAQRGDRRRAFTAPCLACVLHKLRTVLGAHPQYCSVTGFFCLMWGCFEFLGK